MIRLNISPDEALVDERISITVTGLRPLQHVTVQALVAERKAVFSSCAHFIADKDGHVDINQQTSLGGTYKGVDSMGLFWSMKSVPGVSMSALLRQVDMTTPLVFKLSVIDHHVPFTDLQLPKTIVLTTGELKRWYKQTSVSRIVVRDGSLRGSLFLPAGEGPFPGVIDMFGGGGLVEFRAGLLASRGFAVLALAYFGYDDLPSLSDLDIAYFLNAVDWMASNPYVKGTGIGVVAVSKGAQIAFLLCMATNKVKALVSINGLPFLLHFDIKSSGNVYWKAVKVDTSKVKHSDEGVHLKDGFVCDTEIIPAWKNNAKILYLCGDDDGTWSTDHARTFVKTCPEGKRENIELVIYPGAGHLIEPPYMPVCRAMYHKVAGVMLVMGGQAEAHAAAQEDAWTRLLDFLHKHLSQEHQPICRL